MKRFRAVTIWPQTSRRRALFGGVHCYVQVIHWTLLLLFSHGACLHSMATSVRIPPVYPQEAADAGIGGEVEIEYWVTSGCELEVRIVDSQPPGVFDEATRKNFQRMVHDEKIIDWDTIPNSGGDPPEIMSQEESENRWELAKQWGPWPVQRFIRIFDTDSGYLQCLFTAQGELEQVEYREQSETKWRLEKTEIPRVRVIIEPRSTVVEYIFEGD